jgi:DNA (cytosine-5)-methyltransferase 1
MGQTKLKVLDLFSGIGGFSLGLERTGGFETVAFCEIEEFPRRVLAKHWPEVPCYDDVRTLTADRLRADGIAGIDVITGGFPCQDISVAGNQAGIVDGSRSGLWSEIVRLAGELSPSLIIVENVANLLAGPSERPGGWFGRVLGDLAALGYDAEWENIPAAALGAPHRRERVWLVAYTNQDGCVLSADTANRILSENPPLVWEPFRTDDLRVSVPKLAALCGSYDGVPDELGAYGNAVVPQIPELIGNAIIDARIVAAREIDRVDEQLAENARIERLEAAA